MQKEQNKQKQMHIASAPNNTANKIISLPFFITDGRQPR